MKFSSSLKVTVQGSVNLASGSDGSKEETDYLTAMVAKKFMEKALFPFQTAIQNKEMNEKVKALNEGKIIS